MAYIVLHGTNGEELHIKPNAIDMLGFDSEDDTVFLYRSGCDKPICLKENIEEIKILFNLSGKLSRKGASHKWKRSR